MNYEQSLYKTKNRRNMCGIDYPLFFVVDW